MKTLQVLILIKFVDSPPYPKYIPAEKFLAHQRATKINYLEPKKCMLIKCKSYSLCLDSVKTFGYKSFTVLCIFPLHPERKEIKEKLLVDRKMKKISSK